MAPAVQHAVVICDDHPLIRIGMAGALAGEPRLTVVAEAGTPEAAVAALGGHPEAVLIVRDRFLDDGPLAGPGVGVVAGIDLASDERLFALAGRGVRALIHRDGPPDHVRQAALAVSRGSGFIAPDLVLPFLRVVRDGAAAPAGDLLAGGHLTPRESDVLRLLSRGQANREIAGTLRITEKTVKFHVSNLLAKAGLRTRAQLIAVTASLVGGPGRTWSAARRQHPADSPGSKRFDRTLRKAGS